MRISESQPQPPDYTALLPVMLEICKKNGLSESFAAESGIFLGTLFRLMGKEGADVEPSVFGALACIQPLTELFKQGLFAEVLHYGQLILTGMPESGSTNASLREVIASARSSVLSNLSVSAKNVGNLAQALAYADEDLRQARKYPDTLPIGRALNNRGLALQELKRFREAEQCYREGIEIVQDALANQGHASNRALLEALLETLLSNLRTLQAERGEALSEALPVTPLPPSSGPLNDYPGLFKPPSNSEVAAANDRGLMLMQQGKPSEAIDCFLKARTLLDENRSPAELRGIIECNLAGCFEQLGRMDEAHKAYRQAISIHESDPACWDALSKDLFNDGLLYQKTKDYSQALARFKRAWSILLANNETTILSVSVLGHIALCRFLEHDYRRAKAALDRALGIYEKLRPNLAEAEEGHSGTLDRYRSALELYLYLATHEDWVELGCALIERGKARFWYESLFALDAETASLQKNDHTYIHKDGSTRKIDDGVAVYSFITGHNAIFASVEFHGGQELHRFDIPHEELFKLVVQIRTELQARRPYPGGFSEAARSFSRKLLGRTAHILRRARDVLVMPDGPLWALPFDALPVESDSQGEQPLGQLASVSVAPSWSVLGMLSKPRTGAPSRSKGETVVLSDPAFGPGVSPLPGTRDQAEHILEVLSRQSPVHLHGPLANREEVLARLESCSLLHLATHASGDLGKGAALLYLSDGEGGTSTISATEILTRRLIARLVVLSACESSIGPESVGEGLMSITRAFLRAGASCVVSTLWRVEDMESARLMRDFYGGIASGESVALAMSAAKNRQRSNGLPGRTWAAFQVYGDGSICPVTIESTNFRMGSNHASESR